MNSWAQSQGQPGLAYIFFRDGEGAGPLAKNVGPERTEKLKSKLGLRKVTQFSSWLVFWKTLAAFAGGARDKSGEGFGPM